MEEEKGNSQRMQDQVNSLTSKMKSVKRDKEEAEGEVDNLRSKLRQAKAALDDSEDQVAMLQAQLSKARSSVGSARSVTSSARKKASTIYNLFLLLSLNLLYAYVTTHSVFTACTISAGV